MQLSEAIRLGAVLGKQMIGKFNDGDDNTCAVGAAGLAIGLKYNPMQYVTEIREAFPLLKQSVQNPVKCDDVSCGRPHRILNSVGATIIHLNDSHNWSREKIADWVQSVEREVYIPEVQPVSAVESDTCVLMQT